MQLTRLKLPNFPADNSSDHAANGAIAGSFGRDRRLICSRRSFFGWAGAAAVGYSAAARVLSAATLGRCEVVRQRGRVAFLLGGEERWVIDVRRFGGRPRLALSSERDVVRVGLIDALLPGTAIPADLCCEIRPSLVSSKMRLRLLLGGFDAVVPFERWLAGEVECSSLLRKATARSELAPGASLRLAAGGTAEFAPDWSLRLAGRQVATLTILDAPFSSELAELSLLGAENPTILERPCAKRSLLSLARREEPWRLGALLPRSPMGRLVGLQDYFDLLHVESGEGRSGERQGAMLAERAGEDAGLFFEPASDLRSSIGAVFRLPLRRARFGRTLDNGSPEGVIRASFAKEPVWLEACGNRIVGLADASHSPPFELLQRGRSCGITCEPALLAVSAALPGAIAGLLRPRQEARLAFLGASASAQVVQRQPKRPTLRPRPEPKQEQQPDEEKESSTEEGAAAQESAGRSDVGEVRLDPEGVVKVVLPANLVVPVVRPADLLALDFEFVNLTLDTQGGNRLVRRDDSTSAHIIVHFPPQSVAEQAFFEVAEEFKARSTSTGGRWLTRSSELRVRPGADGEGGGPSDPLPTPPVESRISGPSRLVFRLPVETTSIDYTLDALLEACRRFPLEVAATAIPPDPPLLTATLRRALRILKAEPKVRRKIEARSPGNRQLGTGSASVRGRLAPQAAVVLAHRPGGPSPPDAHETAIEMPYRLIVSPHGESAWAHARQPVKGRSGRYELWHTRLGVRADDGSVDETDTHYRTIRAIWSPDYRPKRFGGRPPVHYGAAPEDPEGNPFRTSLDSRDRHEIVSLTADFSGALQYLENGSTRPYKPLPVRVGRMFLTSLGAWLESRGTWEPPVDTATLEEANARSHARGLPLEVEEWRHQATMARDHYVKVVYKGFLFPFRHRASLIKVTERKFQPVETGPLAGKTAAFLRQRMYIVVREPEVTYDYSGLPAVDQRRSERRNPFKRVRITTLTTPSLNKPEESDVGDVGQSGFWPRVGDNDFLFHLIGWDWRGDRVEFSAPLLFISASLAGNKDFMRDVVVPLYAPEELGGSAPAPSPEAELDLSTARRTRSLDGQKIAYAEAAARQAAVEGDPDNTTLETASITFGAAVPGLDDPGYRSSPSDPIFFPILSRAEVRIPAVAAIVGSSRPSIIKYSDIYADNETEDGFGGVKNQGEVFAELLAPTELVFPADRSGGLATPNINIAGLSRRFGPVGAKFDGSPDLSGLAAGEFEPQDFFGGAGAKILGGIDLWDIIAPGKVGGGNVPELTTSVVYPGGDRSKPPEATRADLFWQPRIQSDPAKVFVPGSGSTLTLRARIIKRFDAKEPETSIEGELTDFAIDLIGNVESFLIVKFDHIRFSSHSGEAMEVDPKISGVEFAGPLKFVRELAELLPKSGFTIDVSPEGVKAGLGVGLPAITSGHLNLYNIGVNAGLLIPFSGDPVRLRFAFCERDNPFALTIYCFGGGGFVALALGLDGVETLEVALEFGATVSLDLGVASGGLYAMAGIYMALEEDRCSLSGYLRMGGELEVLALITISIEFYMTLTYEAEENKVWGEARVTVEVEILMVSVPVELTVRREFFDPEPSRFNQWMSEPEWAEYCAAFAA